MNCTTCIAIYYQNNKCVGHQKLISKDEQREVLTLSAGKLKLSIYVFIQYIKCTSLQQFKLKFVSFLYNMQHDISLKSRVYLTKEHRKRDFEMHKFLHFSIETEYKNLRTRIQAPSSSDLNDHAI